MTDQKTPWSYDYNPYRTNDDREIPCFEIVDSEGRRVATTDEDTTEELQEADAKLLSSAPELRGALQNIVNGIESNAIRVETAQDETWANALRRARMALAKAGGPS
jgi:hypothetical protein